MKYVLLVLMLALLPLRGYAFDIDSLISRINKTCKAVKLNNTKQNQNAFFCIFPSSARQLAFIEDYILETDNNTDMHEWFESFENLTTIDDSSYCSKLISLSIGAQLDADAFNYLQLLLHRKLGCQVCHKDETYDKINNLLIETLHQLNLKTDGEIMRFWQFYFSSLWFEEDGHSVDNSHKKELDRIISFSNGNRKMQHIIKIAYKYSSNQVFFISQYDHPCR